MGFKKMIDKWLFGKPGGLLGTRSMVTLIIAGVTAAMWALEIPISDVQNDALKLVLAFYFITRAVQSGTNMSSTEGIDQPTKPPEG